MPRAAENVKGRPRAVRALALVNGRSESPWETLLRLALDVPQLPQLELQIEIRDDTGRLLGRTDGGYLAHGVLIEFDGLVTYGRRLRAGQTADQAVVAEKRREEGISGLGWLVIRVIAAELREPQRLIGRIRRACQDRQRLVQVGAIRGSAVPRPPLRLDLGR